MPKEECEACEGSGECPHCTFGEDCEACNETGICEDCGGDGET